MNESNESHLDKMKEEKYVPEVKSILRSKIVQLPEVIYRASGIKILGKRIKSLIFTTDIALIQNHNAQAIMAVYPFTPQLSITKAILEVASVPVFAGVGGGVTSGVRSVNIALQAELLGAHAVVVNAPVTFDVIAKMNQILDIPIVATVVDSLEDVEGKLKAGASILNVSGAAKTSDMVWELRKRLGREVPIIATGGPTDDTILSTIQAGANAITYTPPSVADLFSESMQNYRKNMRDLYSNKDNSK